MPSSKTPSQKSKSGSTDPERASDEAVKTAIDKALTAARLADDAAQDIETLRKDSHAFADKMHAHGKMMTQLALGAGIGALAASLLSGLVYFRSINDLRDTTRAQAEVLAKMVEQTGAMGAVITEIGNRQGSMIDELGARTQAQLDTMQTAVIEQINTKAGETIGNEAQFASGIADLLSTDLQMIRNAVTELDSKLTLGIAEAGLAIPPELLTRLDDILKAAQKATPVKPAPAPKRAASKSAPAKPAAPAPNPFRYP